MKTSKELAEELGVVTQTIRNEANNQGIEPTKQGKYFYFADDDAASIKAEILGRRTDKETNKREQNKRKTDKQQSNHVFALQKEIRDKDKQIETLQNEKAFLMKQLADATESLKAAHESLNNITESLKAAQVTAQTATLRIAQHDERSWWQRLFGIRKKADGDQGEV